MIQQSAEVVALTISRSGSINDWMPSTISRGGSVSNQMVSTISRGIGINDLSSSGIGKDWSRDDGLNN
eukprot:2381502-Ditylum_brightwellii.AAC.1